LKRARINGEQQLTAFNRLTFPKVNAIKRAANAGANVNSLGCFETTCEFIEVLNLALNRRRD
jgi:hypothetical protein